MKNLFTLVSLTLIVAVFAFMVACGGGEEKQAETKMLMIKGSDTMVHLCSSWAEHFMNTHEGSEVSVTGGGSGTGIAALINGTTDICAASRKIKEKEITLAEEQGIHPLEHVVALDGIAVCINPENPINELTIEQLGKIFTGAYTSWSQVGGPDEKIIVLSRESSSGTYVFFQEEVLNKKDYTTEARLMPATSSIVQATEADKWAIGYIGLGYASEAGNKIKVLAVKVDDASAAVIPSTATVLDGTYSIARPLHLYTKGEPTGIAAEFLNFCLSPEGQNIVAETGYVKVK